MIKSENHRIRDRDEIMSLGKGEVNGVMVHVKLEGT